MSVILPAFVDTLSRAMCKCGQRVYVVYEEDYPEGALYLTKVYAINSTWIYFHETEEANISCSVVASMFDGPRV